MLSLAMNTVLSLIALVLPKGNRNSLLFIIFSTGGIGPTSLQGSFCSWHTLKCLFALTYFPLFIADFIFLIPLTLLCSEPQQTGIHCTMLMCGGFFGFFFVFRTLCFVSGMLFSSTWITGISCLLFSYVNHTSQVAALSPGVFQAKQ